MGRFDEKFTDDQRMAIIGAVMGDDGPALSVPKVRELALRGQLAGLPPFEMSAAYIYDLRRREHKGRAGDAPFYPDGSHAPGDRLDGIVNRMVSALDANMRRYERRAKAAARPTRVGTKTQPPNPADLAAMAKAAQEIRKAQRAPLDVAKRDRKPETKAEQDATPLARMMREHKATQGQSSPGLAGPEGPPNVTTNTERSNARAEHHEAQARQASNASAQHEGQREASAEADFRRVLAQLGAEAEGSS